MTNPDAAPTRETSPFPALPSVIKVGDFNTEATPYDINIDTPELARIMREYFHLPGSEIEKIDFLLLSADMPWKDAPVSQLTKEQIRTLE